ncbi:hypothetical protein KR222_007411, partial [Zaprionus bogoriensis]
MDVSCEVADLQSFSIQLELMEKLMKRASEYNQKLTEHIEKMKNIVKSNQVVFQKVETNSRSMKSLVRADGLDEMLNSNLMKHSANIEEKLYVTATLFEDFKNQRCGRSDHRLSQQLKGLGANLISIGNEIMMMRQDKAAMESNADALYQRSCR